MMSLLAMFVFVVAAMLAIGVIAAMIVPQWHRIMRLASGQIEQSSAEAAR